MYGKLFASMYDGTLGMKGPWQALVTFQQMIILADKRGVVDMTAEAIARRTTIPMKIIDAGIAALEQPDKASRTPDEEGRRILRLSPDRDWGWQITNYAKYREIRTADERREYHRQYWHKRKLNNSTETQPSQPIAVSRKQEAEGGSTAPDASRKGKEPTDLARLDAVIALTVEHIGPAGTSRFIPRPAVVRSFGEEVALAFDRVGGSDGILKNGPQFRATMARDLGNELRAIREAE